MSVAALGGPSRLLNSKWFHYLMALRLKMHVLQIGLVCWALTGFAVSAQADGTAGDTKIVLTVADLSTGVGDLKITYTNNNAEIKDTAGNPLATDAAGVTIDVDATAPTFS